jgi:excinuclease ABC subunit C
LQLTERKPKDVFGPFPSPGALREALRIIRKIFPFYDGAQPVTKGGKHGKASIEFYRQIKRAPSEVDHVRYRENIRHIAYFLGGRKKKLLTDIERMMKRAAKEERFEDAAEYRRQLFALTHIQDVSLIKEELRRAPGIRIEAYDVAHTSGRETVGVMVVVKDGEPAKSEYRTFTIRTKTNDDIGSLRELLTRRFSHYEWQFPQLLVVDGGRAHKRAAEELLASMSLPIPVVAVVKDEYHRPRQVLGRSETLIPERDIILANAESHRVALARHRRRRSKIK